MEAGRLPNRQPDRMWGGAGVGAHCTICDAALMPDEIELEIQFAGEDGGDAVSYHVHPSCFAAWDLELRSTDPIPKSVLPGAPALSATSGFDGQRIASGHDGTASLELPEGPGNGKSTTRGSTRAEGSGSA